jgi:hypothetical protein
MCTGFDTEKGGYQMKSFNELEKFFRESGYYIRIPDPISKQIERDAEQNNIKPTQMVRYYFWRGFNTNARIDIQDNRWKRILENALNRRTT